MEACYKLTEKLTLDLCYQYAWCQTHAKVGHLVDEKSHSNGASYTVGLEYSFDSHWTLNAGFVI